jgi:hypothetical protein
MHEADQGNVDAAPFQPEKASYEAVAFLSRATGMDTRLGLRRKESSDSRLRTAISHAPLSRDV